MIQAIRQLMEDEIVHQEVRLMKHGKNHLGKIVVFGGRT
jgi:hypothetical protein